MNKCKHLNTTIERLTDTVEDPSSYYGCSEVTVGYDEVCKDCGEIVKEFVDPSEYVDDEYDPDVNYNI